MAGAHGSTVLVACVAAAFAATATVLSVSIAAPGPRSWPPKSKAKSQERAA